MNKDHITHKNKEFVREQNDFTRNEKYTYIKAVTRLKRTYIHVFEITQNSTCPPGAQ